MVSPRQPGALAADYCTTPGWLRKGCCETSVATLILTTELYYDVSLRWERNHQYCNDTLCKDTTYVSTLVVDSSLEKS